MVRLPEERTALREVSAASGLWLLAQIATVLTLGYLLLYAWDYGMQVKQKRYIVDPVVKELKEKP